jgi:ZIP family zinc transporter
MSYLAKFVLSFGLAALMFLVTEELLVEAHEEPETPLSPAMFFVGFLLFLIVGMVA